MSYESGISCSPSSDQMSVTVSCCRTLLCEMLAPLAACWSALSLPSKPPMRRHPLNGMFLQGAMTSGFELTSMILTSCHTLAGPERVRCGPATELQPCLPHGLHRLHSSEFVSCCVDSSNQFVSLTSLSRARAGTLAGRGGYLLTVQGTQGRLWTIARQGRASHMCSVGTKTATLVRLPGHRPSGYPTVSEEWSKCRVAGNC